MVQINNHLTTGLHQIIQIIEWSCIWIPTLLHNFTLTFLISDVAGLRQPLQVELLQDQTHLMLQEYCGTKPPISPSNRIRFGRLLLALPSLAQFPPKTLEAIFFRKTVGNIAIERVIADLFQST